MLQIVRTIGWLVCAVYSTIPPYWLLIHPRASYWRAQARSPYRTLMPLSAIMWVVIVLATAPWRRVALYQHGWTWIPAVGLFALGLWLYRTGGAHFSLKQLSGVPELRAESPEQRLVTTGVRARIRHPVYLAHLCEMLAWSFGTGLVACFALTAFAIFTGGFMICTEDAELERRFGDAYRSYRKSVPAVVPKFR